MIGMRNMTDGTFYEIDPAVAEKDAEIARLRAEVEAYRQNAERYLWLRDKANNSHRSAPMVAANPLDREYTTLIHSDELDSAIDAAMGASA